MEMKKIIETVEKKNIKLVQTVYENGQEGVFRYWNKLNEDEKTALLKDLKEVDFEQLNELIREHIVSPRKKPKLNLSPPEVVCLPKTKEDINRHNKARERGIEAVRKGEVAIFVVAGGQGSRLGFDGPKGKLPITQIKKKTLFELFSEKIKAISKRYGVVIPWFIMTSEENDKETREYYEDNNYFAIDKKNVFIFKQGRIPSVDLNGKIILSSRYQLAMNPDGHGGSITALNKSGAIDFMKKRGIRYIFYHQVDNPLIVMADPIFIGYHILNKSEMSAKVLPKACPEEKVGVYGYMDGKLGVIEYSDLSKEDMYAQDSNGNLLYNSGNPAIHMINVGFIESSHGLSLPFHVAKKKIISVDGEIEGVKFETFIFDALGEADNPTLLEIRRDEEFSPTKNKEGVDSIESSRRMMNNFFGKWLEEIGIKIPRKEGNVNGDIEISPLYALDKEEFLKKYKDKPALNSGFRLYVG